jgi:hypothetical protein
MLSPKFRLAHDAYRLSCIVSYTCVVFCWPSVQPELYISDRITGEEMVGLGKPRRRWWGWLVAVAYLLASMTPSLAIPVPLDVSSQCEHEAEGPVVAHEHDHADVGSAAHSHDVAMTGDCDDDQDQHRDRHAGCCGSVLCFSAVSPQAPLIADIVAPRSLCETQPDVIGDEGAFRRHYRPPIA